MIKIVKTISLTLMIILMCLMVLIGIYGYLPEKTTMPILDECLFSAQLAKVQYRPPDYKGGKEVWMLVFTDKRTLVVHDQPTAGFIAGAVYEVYLIDDIYYFRQVISFSRGVGK